MAALLAFAFVSGIVTILSPCILPVLPILLAGGVSGGRARPLGIVAGFVVSFAVFTLTLTAIVQVIGIPAGVLRIVAVVVIAAFGLVLVVPRLQHAFERLTSRIAGRGASGGGPVEMQGAGGFLGGLPVGLSLGLVWTPCVGPIMASVIGLALTRQIDGGAVFITMAYTLGTSIPMLGVMLGGRALLARVPVLRRNTARIQKAFGVLMIVVGVAIGFGLDRRLQTAILRGFPNYGAGLTAVENAEPVERALEAREAPETGGESPGRRRSPPERVPPAAASKISAPHRRSLPKGRGSTRRIPRRSPWRTCAARSSWWIFGRTAA